MPLEAPSFMPSAPPDRTATADVLEYRRVPGISFHEDGDGIVYYYDQPLVYVAWHEGRMVLATLTDEAYEGPPERARGWKQTFLIEVDAAFLARVHASELPFRALYDQEGTRTWFVHEDWQYAGDRTWTQQVRVYAGVPFPEASKPDRGVYLDPTKDEAETPIP